MAEGSGRKKRKPWNLREDDIVRQHMNSFKPFGLTQQEAVKVIKVYIELLKMYLADENMPDETTIDMTGLCTFRYKKKEGLKKGHVQKVMKNWETNETEMKVWEKDDPDYRILKCELNQTLYNKVKETAQGKV